MKAKLAGAALIAFGAANGIYGCLRNFDCRLYEKRGWIVEESRIAPGLHQQYEFMPSLACRYKPDSEPVRR
ncbi:MAG: hypothetical protein AB1324_07240 [Candidatus Micrarchaeota archaeon]